MIKLFCLIFFRCIQCSKELPFNDINGTLDHFSTHIWVKIQESNSKKGEDLFNGLFMSLPLEPWLKDQGLVQDHGEGKKFMTEMRKRVQDIIR